MSSKIDNLLNKISDAADWQLGLVTQQDLNKKTSISSFKSRLAQTAFADEFSVDAIYFSGENPFIHFKSLYNFNPEVVRKLHRKIWNEGRVPLLAIITPIEIRLYDCFDTPPENLDDLNNLERGCFKDTEDDLGKLVNQLHQSKIDSGIIWKEQFGKSIKTNNRVDRKLINNLAATRNELYKNYHIPLDIIHDLLGRSLFTLYLEDRGILIPEIYPSKPEGVNNFFDLLDYDESVYKLFHFLEKTFNGDLFPVTTKEERIIKKNPECLELIKYCFSGSMDIATRQLALGWRMFQFQYIPIELISSIYEEFMSKEDEKHEKIKKDGVIYTPLMLVEFVLNVVLPWPDENNKKYDFKILDPACGSGIFLVESYKRLIARWKYANGNKDINKDVLEQLLLKNIYGVEKDPEAIKIAAFSLYLTFLNYIESEKVLSKIKFEPLIRWKNKKELTERKNTKPGKNLFQFSTFKKGLEIFENEFDLIIGNPPWKRGGLDDDVKKYLKENRLPQQIMCAYLHFMPKLITDGIISLISTAKILFNTGQGYENFRKKFFTENNIDAIINLSVVRDIIFKNATSPGAVFIYSKKNPEADDNRKEYVTYYVPKSIETIKHRQSIVIDASEVKFLPIREILKQNSKIFKIAMWGNVRDLKLIEKIKGIKSIKGYIENNDWGVGLKIKDEKAPAGNIHLKNYPLLPTEKVDHYFTTTSNFPLLGDKHKTFRTNNKNIFNAPIIIIKEGSKDAEFCCSYLTSDTVYLSSVLGISISNKNEKFHKALVACLNSTIASYYFFITSSSWGIDKGGRVQNNDAISFPALPYSMNETKINELAEKVDEIIIIKKSNKIVLNEKDRIQKIRKDIDEIIYKELKISDNERALINDALNYSIVLHNRYRTSKAEAPANLDNDILPYAKTLSKTIGLTLEYINKGVWVEIVYSNNDREPVKIIALHFDNEHEYGSCKISKKDNISKLLMDINKYCYEQHSESVYYRKLVKYYKGNIIYFIKPNKRRFWTISQALNDADEILIELLNQ